MKTLVIYDATDPVQVTGAALLKKSIGTDFVLSTTVTGTAEKVWNLNDVDTDSFSEDQYEIADEVLGYNFAGLTLETAPTIFTSGTLGKTGLTWEVDEHAGKWCYIKADTTNDLVLIESNTATTLTFVNTLVNTPDGDSEFAIIPSEDINLVWLDINPAALAWGTLSLTEKNYPVELMAGSGLVYSGLCNASASTASVSGFAASSLVGMYAAIQDATSKAWFTRKIKSNTTSAIGVDRAWGETITNSSTLYIYDGLSYLLRDIYFELYADVYMSHPNHPYWNELIDSEGRLSDGIVSYNQSLFDTILADGKVMFDALQISNGGSLSYLDY